MSMDFIIANLRKQKNELDELILKLSKRESLKKEDLDLYDATTKRIEKRLRRLKEVIDEEASKSFSRKQSSKKKGRCLE